MQLRAWFLRLFRKTPAELFGEEVTRALVAHVPDSATRERLRRSFDGASCARALLLLARERSTEPPTLASLPIDEYARALIDGIHSLADANEALHAELTRARTGGVSFREGVRRGG